MSGSPIRPQRLLGFGRAGCSVLTEHVSSGHFPSIALRVSGIYRSLDTDCCGPYWSNWVQDIRALNPDSLQPPAFVLMPESTLARVARKLHPVVENRFEIPATTTLTVDGAKELQARLASLERQITSGDSQAARQLGCAEA